MPTDHLLHDGPSARVADIRELHGLYRTWCAGLAMDVVAVPIEVAVAVRMPTLLAVEDARPRVAGMSVAVPASG